MPDRSEPSVTVVIAAFNAVPFVQRAINSALEQQECLEVLVVDDASLDQTAEFVRRHFEAQPRVRVIGLPHNSGPGAARNAGLEQARGRWMAVLDADDAFEAGHLRELVALAEETAADLVASNFQYYDVDKMAAVSIGLSCQPDLEVLDRYSFADGARPYTNESDFGLLQPLFNVDFLRSHNLRYPEEIRHGEDVELVLFALVANARYVVKRSLCSYLYTTRDSGQSRTRLDYGAQVERTMKLRREPRICGDHRLKRLLTNRAYALRKLELDRNLDLRVMSRSAIVQSALKTAFGRRWLLARMVKKIVD